MLKLLIVALVARTALCFINAIPILSLDRYAAHAHEQKAPFCHDLDCPKYTLLQTFNEYELRRYEMTQWVSARMVSRNYSPFDNTKLFFSLFGYIAGNNTSGGKIPMTAPVLMTVTPNITSAGDTGYEMHFMIPHNIQPFPPLPLQSSVYITSLPPMDVYVMSFGGRPRQSDYEMKVSDLRKAINDNSMYDDHHYFTAGYDGPYTISNRHNEVWLLKKINTQ